MIRRCFGLAALLVVACAATVAAAADDLKNLKPGTKLIVDWAGETVGEFIEYSRNGWLKVRIKMPGGREQTPTLSPTKFRLAPANAVYGERIAEEPREPKPAKGTENEPKTRPATPQSPRTATAPPGTVPPGGRPMPPFGPRGFGRPGAFPPSAGPGGVPPRIAGTTPGAPTPAGSPSAATTQPVEPPSDKGELAALNGSWQAVKVEVDGREKPGDVPYKIRFTPQVLYIAKLPMGKYRVDATKTPKQLYFGVFKADMAAIYELSGDTLKICMAGTSGSPAPTDFTTKAGDGRSLVICQRAKDPASLASQPLPQTDPEITARVGEFLEILKTQGLVGFVEQCLPPAEQQKLTSADREAIRQVPPEQINTIISAMSATRYVTPTFTPAKTTAIFDLSGIHVEEDAANLQDLTLVKVDGKWYVSKD